MPFAGKPIIGIVGGIAAGKSYVSSVLRELGCVVIDSDAISHAVYADPEVRERLVQLFGPEVVGRTGEVDRRVLAGRVFRDARERARLEGLVHPLINARREAEMTRRVNDSTVRAFVWDSPLLIEAGLHTQCDAILFVDTPYEERLRRVREARGWDAGELARREGSQAPLSEKRRVATATVPGNESPDALAGRLRHLLSELSASVAG